MSNLLDYVNDARPYRSLWTPKAFARKCAVVCHPDNADRALTWFATKHGREVDYLVLDVPVTGNGRVSILPMAALRDNPDIEVIVFGPRERPLAVRLAAEGCRCFSFALDPVYKHVKYDRDYFRHNREPLEAVFGMLEDEESRLTLASVVKQRITSDHGHLRIARYREYEHPHAMAQAGEWVADCGASDGNTSFRFARRAGPSGKVYAFEPDPANAQTIRQAIPRQPADSAPVTVINAAVSDQPGSLRFSSGKGGSSTIDPNGNIEVPVCTLNDFAAGEAISGAGVISLDVEGFEQEALSGGLEMIQALRPKLQVSIYHKMEDLFSIPLWLKAQLSNYVYYIGHHDSYHSETDLYAVPRERLI